MRVATWNIQAGSAQLVWHAYVLPPAVFRAFVDTPYKRRTLERMGNYLEGEDPVGKTVDIALLQEVDDGLHKTLLSRSRVNQLEVAQGAGGFQHRAYGCAQEILGVSRQGNGILSRYPIEEIREHPLPHTFPLTLEKRGVLEALVATPEGELVVVNTHIGLSPSYREEQLWELARILIEAKKRYGERPLIVGGDFNSIPYETLESFMAITHLRDAFQHGRNKRTHPYDKPTRNLDHLMVSREVEVAETHVYTSIPVTDHALVVADIHLR
ncbi:TPA: hypothetical protein HA249_07010 [Candidatus Woesearchaeota archaeon]|nr:hypothetical protein [Candidatus Woesearchaeota archaeon]HII89091.1 hypothetical protein [Candidatus Woesearchaeota archaeon]